MKTMFKPARRSCGIFNDAFATLAPAAKCYQPHQTRTSCPHWAHAPFPTQQYRVRPSRTQQTLATGTDCVRVHPCSHSGHRAQRYQLSDKVELPLSAIKQHVTKTYWGVEV
jgi:hypothetical protein